MNLRVILGLSKGPAEPRTEPAERLETPKERFYATLQSEFSPRLRAAGFKGSGRNFRRVVSDVIHAINIQGDKYGESGIVNLGVHLTFLPDALGKMPQPSGIREISCEFRTRIARGAPPGTWWPYGKETASAEANARSLIHTYFTEGEAYFQHFNAVSAILDALERKVAHRPEPSPTLGSSITLVRAAHAAARIHRHLGHSAQSQDFARIGLANIGPYAGVGLRPELERLAQPST